MPRLRRAAWSRLVLRVAVLAPAAFLLIKAYHHFVAPDLNPVVDPINIDHFLGRHLSPSILCHDKAIEPRIELRGEKYWVLYNYIRSSETFHCNETVTLTTHGGFSYMDNLFPLLERWQGPLSVAVFAPGDDYSLTIKAIMFQRHCLEDTKSDLVRRLATFHIFFPDLHIPPEGTDILSQKELAGYVPNCARGSLIYKPSYRERKEIRYPINVARNIARESAATHFVFASDIELYPSPGLISNFLEMIGRNEPVLRSPNPKVFVNPVFEIEKGYKMPANKSELVEYLSRGVVIPFHKEWCETCHKIPDFDKWQQEDLSSTDMRVFRVAKRYWPYDNWEPFFLGTHTDPLFDDRLTWEGRGNKMILAYQMCVLDYEFHILSNSFLIHREGIMRNSDNQRPPGAVEGQNLLAQEHILPALNRLFGTRKGCRLLHF